MRKITFKKAILLILVVSLLSIGLNGCIDITIPTTGTVKVIIMDDYYSYYVYMDGEPLGKTPKVAPGLNSEKTFYNIPIGLHEFYVISTDYKYEGWKEQTIFSGYNTVEIYTYLIY